MRHIDIVADAFEREIGFDAGAHIEIAAMKQRPAAVIFLNAAQIFRHALMQRLIDRAEKMIEQNVFGRDGDVGFKLERPMPVGMRCSFKQRVGRPARTAVELDRRPRPPRGGTIEVATTGACSGCSHRLKSAARMLKNRPKNKGFRLTS